MDWLKLLIDFGRDHPFLVAVNVIMILLVPVNEIILPQWYGRLISAFQSRKPLGLIFVIVVILIVTTRLATYIIEPIDARFTTELQTFVRGRALSTLLDASETQGTLNNGDILARLTKLPACLETIISVWRNSIIPSLLGFTCAAAYLAFHDAVLSLLVTCAGIVYLVAILTVPGSCARESLLRDETYNHMIELIDDVLSNVVSVYSQSQQAQELAIVKACGDDYSKRYIDTVQCYLPAYLVITTASMAFVCAYLYRTHTLMSRRSIDTTALVTILFVMMFSLNSLNRATGIIRPLTLQYGVLQGSTAILQVQVDSDETPTLGVPHPLFVPPQADQTGRTAIELAAVTYRYHQHQVLSDVSVRFTAAKTTVLWGAVGSGKSTMLKLILKYKQPHGGELFLQGEPYSQVDAHDLRKRIAYVPQVPVLFDRTIMENMRYGTTADDAHVQEVAARLGLTLLLQRGLYSSVGKGGALVSGGQRQLILVARALLTGAQIFIFDEPTASLDDESRAVFMHCIHTLKQGGATIIIVTHDTRVLELADRVLTLHAGKVT